jgi:hypothetical protein
MNKFMSFLLTIVALCSISSPAQAWERNERRYSSRQRCPERGYYPYRYASRSDGYRQPIVRIDRSRDYRYDSGPNFGEQVAANVAGNLITDGIKSIFRKRDQRSEAPATTYQPPAISQVPPIQRVEVVESVVNMTNEKVILFNEKNGDRLIIEPWQRQILRWSKADCRNLQVRGVFNGRFQPAKITFESDSMSIQAP